MNSNETIQEVVDLDHKQTDQHPEESISQHNHSLFNSYEKKFAHLDKNVFFSSKADTINSILVRTGVFQGSIDDIEAHSSQLNLAHKDMIVVPSFIKPNFVVDDAFDAAKLVFGIENVIF